MNAVMRIVGLLSRTIRRRPALSWLLVALSIYTLTTCVLLYPLPFRLNAVIVGEDRGDAYQYTWSLWWAKQAVLAPDKGLADLTLMNHPVGLKQPLMLTLIGVNLGALPFSFLLSPAATYNVQVILSFILSGIAMYWLCTELTGDPRAGIVGGFIFAFFLNKTGHVLAGHLPQVTVFWVPLYVLFLWRVIQRPRLKSALIAALLLTAASLIHVLHLVYLIIPVTAIVLFANVAHMRMAFFTRRRVGALALTFALAVLLTLPFLLPTARTALQEDSYLYKSGIVSSSTDLLAFFSPSPYHPVLDALGLVPPFAKQIFPNQEPMREGLAYSGLVVAGLAIWGVMQGDKTVRMWGVLALLAALLSLGPMLKIGGGLVRYSADSEQSYVVLPYALLQEMPLLQVSRTPGRLNETTMFAMAILAAFGTAALSARLAQRPRLLTLLLIGILIAVGFEYVAFWPFPVSTAEIPPTIQSIAREPRDGALLHVEMTRREVNHRALYYQTVTERPVVGGSVHRTLPETLPWWETLSDLARPDQSDGDVIPRPSLSDRVAWLRHFNVDYVVLQRGTESWHDPVYRSYISELLGPPRYEDYLLAAFPVPDEVQEPGDSLLYTFGSAGWHAPEQDGQQWRRWLYDDGQLYIYSPREQIGSLRFSVDSHLQFPVLEVYLGDRLLDSFVVGEQTTLTTRRFALAAGMNVFRFRAPGGCPPTTDSPVCWSEALHDPPPDNPPVPCVPQEIGIACRTFVFDAISFIPQEELRSGEGVDINFDDRMRLRGWQVEEKALPPGNPLRLTLTWEANQPLTDQYVVFVHVLSPDGTLVAQHDAPPVGNAVPASAWSSGTTFSYPITINLPDALPAGDYRLLVGVYLWPSLERLPVLSKATGAEFGAVEMDHVKIEAPR